MSRLLLLVGIALMAMQLASLPWFAQIGLSALVLAILLGIMAGHIWQSTPDILGQKATRFCQQRCLRFGIILFGLSLSFQQIAAVGWQAVILNICIISMIIIMGLWVGIRWLGLPRDVVILISAGSAICGAAAILATDSTLKAKQQQVTVAVATVVIFGTLAMFSYPFIFPYTGMNDALFGIYIGSTVHEVAQAVAAGQSISPDALNHAVITKLIRVMLLAPFVLILGSILTRHNQTAEQGGTTFVIPWFVLGFIVMAAINSLWEVPLLLKQNAALLSQFLLALAMAALGMQTRWCLLREAGTKPILLALVLFMTLIGGGWLLNSWII